MLQFDRKLIAAVKRKREAEGLSLRALSARVGVSFSSLARLERGEGTPDNNTKIRLLEYLGPLAEAEGLAFENVALVHFRAGKNIRTPTVQALLELADALKRGQQNVPDVEFSASDIEGGTPVETSKEELELTAERLRDDLGLKSDEALDALEVEVTGVEIAKVSGMRGENAKAARLLSSSARTEWSAMSVPLDGSGDRWIVLLNDTHDIKRQRVTYLEEVWHILSGHKLTRISRTGDAYGRSYDTAEEHDAYYLASASLLPRTAVRKAVRAGKRAAEIAEQFGVSAALVEYRIKRLGLWRDYTGKTVSLGRQDSR